MVAEGHAVTEAFEPTPKTTFISTASVKSTLFFISMMAAASDILKNNILCLAKHHPSV